MYKGRMVRGVSEGFTLYPHNRGGVYMMAQPTEGNPRMTPRRLLHFYFFKEDVRVEIS